MIISPGDGHCLLYSIITSNNLMPSRRKHYELSDIIESLRNEMVTNADIYVQLSEMKLYIYHKTYETACGDGVPLVTANAWGINIVIVSKIQYFLPNETVTCMHCCRHGCYSEAFVAQMTIQQQFC